MTQPTATAARQPDNGALRIIARGMLMLAVSLNETMPGAAQQLRFRARELGRAVLRGEDTGWCTDPECRVCGKPKLPWWLTGGNQ